MTRIATTAVIKLFIFKLRSRRNTFTIVYGRSWTDDVVNAKRGQWRFGKYEQVERRKGSGDGRETGGSTGDRSGSGVAEDRKETVRRTGENGTRGAVQDSRGQQFRRRSEIRRFVFRRFFADFKHEIVV